MVSGAREAEEIVMKHGTPNGGDKTGNGSGGFGGDKTSKTLGASLKKLVGIDLGLGALLKQSQIFTGYLGNIFAIVGALIDTILAPLAPMAFKALADLGKKIPMIAAMAEKWVPKIANFIGSIFRTIDTIGKFVHKDWAKWAGLFLAGLIAINMTLKLGRIGGSVLGLRQGGAARSIVSAVTNRGATQVATQGATTAAAGGGGMMSRFALSRGNALGGVGKLAGGVGGGIIGGVTSYAGGRNKGMSKGMSLARGATAGLLGAGGAVLGSALGPLGTIGGGAMGVTAGNWLFDKMFAPEAGGGKGGRGGMDVAGQQGLAGYSAPLFIASSARKFSDQVTESGEILAASVMKTVAATDETPKALESFIYELGQAGEEMSQKAKDYIRQSKITQAVGLDPTLAFARGGGMADVRTNKAAMKIQREQLTDELISGKKSGNYDIARSLGFTGSDYTVSGSGDTIRLSQAGSAMEGGFGGRDVDLRITFGGHDGTQQIVQYEQNGKRVDIKMEEDYSTNFP